MSLTVTTETRDGGVVVVRPAGSLDASTSKDLEDVLSPLAADAATTRLILDCAELDYVSSAGLRVMLLAIKSLAPRKAKLYGAGLRDSVVSLLKMTGFLSLMELRPSVDGCLDGGK